jgi:hypothetical protein
VVNALIEIAILSIRFIKSWAEILMTGAAELPGAEVWWPLIVTEAHVDGQERRSLKKLLTAADRAMRIGYKETIAAGCRNGKGRYKRGERERRAMLTNGLETGNGYAF